MATKAISALVDWIHPSTVQHGMEQIKSIFGHSKSLETTKRISEEFDNNNEHLLAAQLVMDIEGTQTGYETLQLLRAMAADEHDMRLATKRASMRLIQNGNNVLHTNYSLTGLSSLTVVISVCILVLLAKYYINFRKTQKAFKSHRKEARLGNAGPAEDRFRV
jgi:hypothetical protein